RALPAPATADSPTQSERPQPRPADALKPRSDVDNRTGGFGQARVEAANATNGILGAGDLSAAPPKQETGRSANSSSRRDFNRPPEAPRANCRQQQVRNPDDPGGDCLGQSSKEKNHVP